MSVTADDSRLWYTYNWGKYFNNTAQLIGALLYWHVITLSALLEPKKEPNKATGIMALT